MAPNVIEVKKVSKSFGGVKAIKDVSFEVLRGEILAIIGPNSFFPLNVFSDLISFSTSTSQMNFDKYREPINL